MRIKVGCFVIPFLFTTLLLVVKKDFSLKLLEKVIIFDINFINVFKNKH